MKKILVIGIGAGDPEFVTVQAINWMNRADVFFLIDKGGDKAELGDLRRQVMERYIRGRSYRTVAVPGDPVRPRSGAPDVAAWRRKRLETYRALVRDELADGETGAFLVWGDPSLYDGTVALLREIRDSAPGVELAVVPGITSVQALAAAHCIPLNGVGEAIQITTGRRLAQGLPREAENVVVLLDAEAGLRAAASADLEVHWGAYLGTPDQELMAGPIGELAEAIERRRAALRARKGWIMDAYLLRRRLPRGRA